MRISISKMAALSGVSVRTLHYYDQIGLLRPREVSQETGYRWYGEAEAQRLREILFYRELDFSLGDIRQILAASGGAGKEALLRQRKLLELKRRRLDRLLALLDDNLKGERMMDFTGFDTEEQEALRRQYAREAQARWGETDAWKESREKERGRSGKKQAELDEAANALFRRFAAAREGSPASPEAQAAVREWQMFLSANYYACTREILAGLGEMYRGDPRFRANLDRFGSGTADFMAAAIAEYCRT